MSLYFGDLFESDYYGVLSSIGFPSNVVDEYGYFGEMFSSDYFRGYFALPLNLIDNPSSKLIDSKLSLTAKERKGSFYTTLNINEDFPLKLEIINDTINLNNITQIDIKIKYPNFTSEIKANEPFYIEGSNIYLQMKDFSMIGEHKIQFIVHTNSSKTYSEELLFTFF